MGKLPHFFKTSNMHSHRRAENHEHSKGAASIKQTQNHRDSLPFERITYLAKTRTLTTATPPHDLMRDPAAKTQTTRDFSAIRRSPYYSFDQRRHNLRAIKTPSARRSMGRPEAPQRRHNWDATPTTPSGNQRAEEIDIELQA